MAQAARCFVWTAWTINFFASVVYLAISMVTFSNIVDGSKFLRNSEAKDTYQNSTLGSCMLGFLMVLFWVVFSFFVLIGRLFGSLPFGYGMVLGSCSHTGFFMLLAGLVLQTHQDLAKNFKNAGIWSDADYTTYVATFAFNYILTGSYLFMFVVLLVTKGSMTGSSKADKYESKPTPSDVALPSAANFGPNATHSAVPSAPPAPANGIPAGHGFGANWPTYGNNV